MNKIIVGNYQELENFHSDIEQKFLDGCNSIFVTTHYLTEDCVHYEVVIKEEKDTAGNKDFLVLTLINSSEEKSNMIRTILRIEDSYQAGRDEIFHYLTQKKMSKEVIFDLFNEMPADVYSSVCVRYGKTLITFEKLGVEKTADIVRTLLYQYFQHYYQKTTDETLDKLRCFHFLTYYSFENDGFEELVEFFKMKEGVKNV